MEYSTLWTIPAKYPTMITAMKSGLFPATHFVLIDLAIDIGQLMPKQVSMMISKTLIDSLLPKHYEKARNLTAEIAKIAQRMRIQSRSFPEFFYLCALCVLCG
jgi:hypothetical protein